jgi:Xaa-Pro aminopeptidase
MTSEHDTIEQQGDAATATTSTTNRRQPVRRASSTRSRRAGPSAPSRFRPRAQARYAAARRDAVSAAFPGGAS